MDDILKSILQTEEEAEKIVAEAKLDGQKISRQTAMLIEQQKEACEKETRDKVEAILLGIREEAGRIKEKILKEASKQAQTLEQQAQDNMSKAVHVAFNRLLATTITLPRIKYGASSTPSDKEGVEV